MFCLWNLFRNAITFSSGTENGKSKGLNIFNGNVKKLSLRENLILPVIGWQAVKFKKDFNNLKKSIIMKNSTSFILTLLILIKSKMSLLKPHMIELNTSLLFKRKIYLEHNFTQKKWRGWFKFLKGCN